MKQTHEILQQLANRARQEALLLKDDIINQARSELMRGKELHDIARNMHIRYDVLRAALVIR